jgi:hypothetical protein
MFDSNESRHRCRNPRCKIQLKETVANPRDAFCCASCEAGFYRTHCRVCEKELGDAKRNSRRELCGRRQCRNQFRSFRAQFFSVWYPNAIGASKPEKSSITSTPKTGIKSDRRFAIGADYDREVLRANFRANAKFWNAAALIGPTDPPVEILGRGHRWSGKSIDRHLVAAIIETEIGGAQNQPDSNRPANPYLAEIPTDLSIPRFLRRGIGSSSS